MQTEHSPFPPDETLAAYIDGRLDEETRKRVVEHMAECPECLDAFSVATEWKRAGVLNPALSSQWHSPRWFVPAAIAAGLAGTVFLTPVLWKVVSTHRNGMADLIAAADKLPYRPVEGRLSGEFSYKNEPPRFRGKNEDEVSASNYEVLAATAKINGR